jgi:hypothetical protein
MLEILGCIGEGMQLPSLCVLVSVFGAGSTKALDSGSNWTWSP